MPCAYGQEFLTWQECIKEAARNHPDLISAKEKIIQSEASKEISKSGLMPQVTASSSVSQAKTSTKSGTTESYDYGASATQLIFDRAKTIDEVNAASENIKAAVEAFRFASALVRYNLKSAFINLLRGQEMVKVTRDIFEIRRVNLELIALRYESGLEHKGALLTAEANVIQAKLDTEKADRDLKVAQHKLIKELGRTNFTPLKAEGNFEIAWEETSPDFTALVKNNPSLQQKIFQKNAARFGINSANADFFPKVSGQAGAGKSDSGWPPQEDQWNAGLTLSWPIFEGGLRTAKLRQAEALYRQYEADERSARESLLYSLEQSWSALKDAIETVKAQEKFLEAAQERARIAEAQYSLGLINFDNWTIIQDDLVKNKKSLLDARANALLAQAGWVNAKGETLEYAQ